MKSVRASDADLLLTRRVYRYNPNMVEIRDASRELRHSFGPILRQLLNEMRETPWNALVNVIARSVVVPTVMRTAAYRCAGLQVAWGASVAPGVRVRGKHLQIGGGSTVNAGCLFDCRAPVTIGRDCGIGFGVQFITTSHALNNPSIRAGVGALEEIHVGSGVYIGSGAVILPGVSIGDGVVVAAGAVVNKPCTSHHLYGGVPAKDLGALPMS